MSLSDVQPFQWTGGYNLPAMQHRVDVELEIVSPCPRADSLGGSPSRLVNRCALSSPEYCTSQASFCSPSKCGVIMSCTGSQFPSIASAWLLTSHFPSFFVLAPQCDSENECVWVDARAEVRDGRGGARGVRGPVVRGARDADALGGDRPLLTSPRKCSIFVSHRRRWCP